MKGSFPDDVNFRQGLPAGASEAKVMSRLPQLAKRPQGNRVSRGAIAGRRGRGRDSGVDIPLNK